VAAVLRRGGEVYEGAISRWRLGDPDSSVASFVPECRTAEHVAWHVCERCYGFGWSAQVCRRPAGT